MNAHQKAVAQECLEGAEANTMTFPQSVAKLREAGFESYLADLRRAVQIHYLPAGESIELPTGTSPDAVAARFDPAAVEAAIREAQALVPGYTYKDFCAKIMAAGCAGYMVSFSGRRAVYFGRTAEIHIEPFPRRNSEPAPGPNPAAASPAAG